MFQEQFLNGIRDRSLFLLEEGGKNMGVGHDFFDELKGGGHNFFDELKGCHHFFFCSFIFKSGFSVLNHIFFSMIWCEY